MLKFESKSNECTVVAAGDMRDVLADVGLLIAKLYSEFYGVDERLADGFRKGVMRMVNDLGDLLWGKKNDKSGSERQKM